MQQEKSYSLRQSYVSQHSCFFWAKSEADQVAVKENDRKTTKMKTVNPSKSQRDFEFVPSIRPSFLSVVLVLVCGCLWVKNEATNERLI